MVWLTRERKKSLECWQGGAYRILSSAYRFALQEKKNTNGIHFLDLKTPPSWQKGSMSEDSLVWSEFFVLTLFVSLRGFWQLWRKMVYSRSCQSSLGLFFDLAVCLPFSWKNSLHSLKGSSKNKLNPVCSTCYAWVDYVILQPKKPFCASPSDLGPDFSQCTEW